MAAIIKEFFVQRLTALFAPIAAAMLAVAILLPEPAMADVYELRTYTTNEGKLDNLNARFRDHTVRLFKKHGMESVGYWVPADEPNSKNTLIYVIKHKSRDAAKESYLRIVYLDTSGAKQDYEGFVSGLDWSQVRSVEKLRWFPEPGVDAGDWIKPTKIGKALVKQV